MCVVCVCVSLTHLQQDPHWYKARRADGIEGMVPFNYVIERKPGGAGQHRNHSNSPDMALASSSRDRNAVMGQRGVVRLHTMPYVRPGKLIN